MRILSSWQQHRAADTLPDVDWPTLFCAPFGEPAVVDEESIDDSDEAVELRDSRRSKDL